MQSIFRLAARRRPAGTGKAFTAPVTERCSAVCQAGHTGRIWVSTEGMRREPRLTTGQNTA